ncbi:MAG: hypothetical protein R3307_03980 [Anaerolineales bacterium]|nr:hypothetical protein [Anaerolineales bacterium]
MNSKLASTLIIGMFLFSACSPATNPPPTATAEEMPVETETVVEIQPETDECLACHTDKQRLIDTASQVEESESESTGVG